MIQNRLCCTCYGLRTVTMSPAPTSLSPSTKAVPPPELPHRPGRRRCQLKDPNPAMSPSALSIGTVNHFKDSKWQSSLSSEAPKSSNPKSRTTKQQKKRFLLPELEFKALWMSNITCWQHPQLFVDYIATPPLLHLYLVFPIPYPLDPTIVTIQLRWLVTSIPNWQSEFDEATNHQPQLAASTSSLLLINWTNVRSQTRHFCSVTIETC